MIKTVQEMLIDLRELGSTRHTTPDSGEPLKPQQYERYSEPHCKR